VISVSDNTAADMLINLVGRPAVQAALTITGMAGPALDRPFLTTREMFILKLGQWPALANRYITANQAGRQALLASTIDPAPLPAVAAAQAWTTPRDINSLEWFASADDICRAYTALAALARRPGLSPIGQVLSLNDGGLQLDPAQRKTTWFKGGSEPGVLTLAYLATTQTGQSYVVTVLPRIRRSPSTRPRRRPRSCSQRSRGRSRWRRAADIRVAVELGTAGAHRNGQSAYSAGCHPYGNKPRLFGPSLGPDHALAILRDQPCSTAHDQ
jgi:Beta-lactamase enzyme family